VTDVPPEPSHADIQSLLGAYALDATEPEESAMVELHLRTCVRCAIEVAHHHEVAGLLADSGGEAPDHLWDGIANRLEGSEPPSWTSLAARLGDDVPDGAGEPETGRVVPIAAARTRRLAAAGGLVAAAALIVAVVLGVQVHHLNQQNATPALTRAEQAALAQPSTKRILLTPPPSSTPASQPVTVVLTRSGTGFVVAHTLAALPAGRTYQLWALTAGRAVSLGLLGRAPTEVVPFSAAGHGGLSSLAITDERAGGAVQPSATPVVEGAVAA
jgi:anti-sigma factor RsiW